MLNGLTSLSHSTPPPHPTPPTPHPHPQPTPASTDFLEVGLKPIIHAIIPQTEAESSSNNCD